jgi:hypothetical protein
MSKQWRKPESAVPLREKETSWEDAIGRPKDQKRRREAVALREKEMNLGAAQKRPRRAAARWKPMKRRRK